MGIIIKDLGLLINAMLIATPPLLLAALGSCFSERSGVVNIGIEGMMTIGAFVGSVVAYYTGNGWFGFFCGGLAGAAFGVLHAVACVSFGADQTISGTAVNFIAPGLAIFLCKAMFDNSSDSPALETASKLPKMFNGIFPAGSFGYNVLSTYSAAYLSFLLVLVIWFVFYKTRFGMRLRAVGEHPKACETLGINVFRIRYICVILSGFLAGLGGAYVTLATVSQFRPNVIVGQGFIAISAVIFGKFTPQGTLKACLLFGFCNGLKSLLGANNIVSPYLISMIPYVVTILALIFFVGKSRVPAANGIMICETDSGFSTPMAFIRTIISKDKDDNVIRKVEFWNSSLVMRFQSLNNGYLNMIAVEEHYWQDVPFVEYINNEERLGDFEGVITEIDAYNKVQSNTANYFQYNDDAILKVLKLGDVSSQDIADMKEKGAIILEDGGDVDWLLKTIDDTALENYKNRLREDIHTGANVPHMCDESFGGNLSGVAISYKLWGLEQICSIKERKFKKGLQRRIELITNILNIMGHNYDYRDIVPKFRRNRPQNDMETAQIVTMLANDLSRETRLQLMPGVENVQDELRKLEEEKNKEQEDFGVYKNFTKAFQGAADRTEAVTDEPEGT